jgi:arsenite methyltransferase
VLTAKEAEYFSFRKGALVAYIRCGACSSIEFLYRSSGLATIGIDPDIRSLKQGMARNPALSLVRGKGEALPFASASLDGILAECSLSVIADKDRALAEFNRVLCPAGRLVVTDVYTRDPHAINSISDLALPFCMSDIMTKKGLSDSLSKNGFGIDLWEDHSYVLKEFIINQIMEGGACGLTTVAMPRTL